MNEVCVRCNDIDDDHRTLWMACFYDMAEMGLPFEKETLNVRHAFDIAQTHDRHFYTLRVCKDCRADWMNMIKDWYHEVEKKESCGSGIFVRKLGKVVEVTLDEFNKMKEEADMT